MARLNHLQSHFAVKTQLARSINYPHAAARYLAEDFVITKKAGLQSRRRCRLSKSLHRFRAGHRQSQEAMRTSLPLPLQDIIQTAFRAVPLQISHSSLACLKIKKIPRKVTARF